MLWGAAGLAQAQDFSKAEEKVYQVSGDIYMLEVVGAGNVAAVVGPDGIVIVDDQFAPLAEKISAALKGVTDKPVRFVINTHFHDDHAGGNVAFGKDATIVAHDNVRKRLAGRSKAPPEALPIVTFDHDLSLHLNGQEIRAIHAPHAHTDGDVIVYFPKSNVVHMGDLFVTYGFPFIDVESGGTSAGMIENLEAALKELPPDVKVIPGHGQVSTPDDVRSFIAMLKETRAAVQRGVKAGRSLEQLKKEKVLEPWQKYSGYISTNVFIGILYKELTGKAASGFVRHN